jgi:uncharacterized protein
MFLIDTNVFLELALDREKAEDCASFLTAVSEGKADAGVTHFTIHAVEATLGKGDRLTKFLRNIESSQGVRVLDTSISEEASIAALTEKTGKLHFDDAVQYFVAKKSGSSAIVSFDRHFDGLDLPRVTPGKVLKRSSEKYRNPSRSTHASKV